jgi:hypothetical protein
VIDISARFLVSALSYFLNSFSSHKEKAGVVFGHENDSFDSSAVLIVIALIFGGVQLLHIYNIYGKGSNRWYYYGSVGVIGLIGIILAAWGFLKKQTTK